MPVLRIALCQINTTVGDLEGNAGLIRDTYRAASEQGADLAVFPEMTVTGYPPEDLLLKPGFVAANRVVFDELVAQTTRCAAAIGFADGEPVHNALGLAANGQLHAVYHKRALPNYGVFDEERYFRAGDEPLELHEVAGLRVGLSICEDIWITGGPVTRLGLGGAQVVVNVNGSPMARGKVTVREEILGERAGEAGCPIVYVNLVGGQDELVFDGGSMIVDAEGRVVCRAAAFEEDLVVVDVDVPDRERDSATYPIRQVNAPAARARPVLAAPCDHDPLDALEELRSGLVLGTRDYVHKSGFGDVCIGLSGGIDSSLVAVLATEALGAEHVHGVLMPSRYSSDHSLTDAQALATNLGIETRVIEIEPAHEAFLEMLATSFGGHEPDVTEENIQSRIRGVLLMALANTLDWLVLTTGNKSEVAVGYSTLYGDTAGAYAVISDVYKLDVYRLCEHVNETAGREIVPAAVITKAPSAELRPDQRDDQSLPPYDELDPLLEAYIEGDATQGELVAAGFDPEIVRRICGLVDVNEYKRRQTPLGPRMTLKAFGRDRRLPIVNRFRR